MPYFEPSKNQTNQRLQNLKLKILSFLYQIAGAVTGIWDPVQSAIFGVKAQRLTYLSRDALAGLSTAVKEIEGLHIPGDIIETGSALGGSAVILALSKAKERKLEIYDVFGMIPEPSENDGSDVHQRYDVIKKGEAVGIQGDEYYGYKDDLVETVTQNIESFGPKLKEDNIKLVKGLFEDTLMPESEVALAHIDCDWYDSVMVSLQRIAPKLSVGGKFIMDDYFDWSGCRDATDDFFQDLKDQYSFETIGNKLHIKKLS